MAKREIITSNSLATDNDYKKDVDLSIKWNRWILKPMGVWPRSRHDSQLELCFNWLINAVCYSLISFLFAPCYLYVSLEVEEVYDKLKLYGPLMFCVMAYIKYYSLMAHTNDIRECIKCIEWDWRNVSHSEDREIMVANAIFGRRLVKICTFFMFSGFVFYYIAVPMSVGKITIGGANRSFIPLVFPVSNLIVDTQRNPSNQIFFSIQFFGGMLIHAIAAGACCLAVAFAVHACGQMQVLMCWLSHLVDGRVDMGNTTNGRIAQIVSQHVRIQKFLTVMEKALTQVSLVEFFGCTVDICLLGYYIIVESRAKDMTAVITYTIILASLIFNIFIFCYIGELVAEQCRKVGQMSYMIDWYRLPENTKLSVVLIMAMSSTPTKLTAGRLVKLSLASFSDVMKTSVAFLNMLRTLTDTRE
ncbi:odorant receptor 4-like [Lasioglossum baleicum]|uniref:odorant receptor 4-like n=1 Tax=Lasioglossum baleicum TaxID=434251 RepID=UPI003FCCC2AB